MNNTVLVFVEVPGWSKLKEFPSGHAAMEYLSRMERIYHQRFNFWFRTGAGQ